MPENPKQKMQVKDAIIQLQALRPDATLQFYICERDAFVSIDHIEAGTVKQQHAVIIGEASVRSKLSFADLLKKAKQSTPATPDFTRVLRFESLPTLAGG